MSALSCVKYALVSGVTLLCLSCANLTKIHSKNTDWDKVPLSTWLAQYSGWEVVVNDMIGPAEFRSPPKGWPNWFPGESDLFEVFSFDYQRPYDYIVITPSVSLDELKRLARTGDARILNRYTVVVPSRNKVNSLGSKRVLPKWRRESAEVTGTL